MDKIYTLLDTIKLDKNNKILVSELVEQKGEIFKLIKNGLQFDDEVLEKAHIKKTIRDVRGYCGIYNKEKDTNKNLPKDTKNVKTILKSINTIEQENLEEYKTPIRQPDTPNLIDEENEDEI